MSEREKWSVSVVMRVRSGQEKREERKASQQPPSFLEDGVGRRGRAAGAS